MGIIDSRETCVIQNGQIGCGALERTACVYVHWNSCKLIVITFIIFTVAINRRRWTKFLLRNRNPLYCPRIVISSKWEKNHQTLTIASCNTHTFVRMLFRLSTKRLDRPDRCAPTRFSEIILFVHSNFPVISAACTVRRLSKIQLTASTWVCEHCA